MTYYNSSGALIYAKPSGDGWEQIVVDARGSNGYYLFERTSLHFNSQNHPQILYYDSYDNDVKFASSEDESVWQIESVAGNAAYPHAVSCGEEELCLCYGDTADNRLYFVRGKRGSWSKEAVHEAPVD